MFKLLPLDVLTIILQSRFDTSYARLLVLRRVCRTWRECIDAYVLKRTTYAFTVHVTPHPCRYNYCGFSGFVQTWINPTVKGALVPVARKFYSYDLPSAVMVPRKNCSVEDLHMQFDPLSLSCTRQKLLCASRRQLVLVTHVNISTPKNTMIVNAFLSRDAFIDTLQQHGKKEAYLRVRLNVAVPHIKLGADNTHVTVIASNGRHNFFRAPTYTDAPSATQLRDRIVSALSFYTTNANFWVDTSSIVVAPYTLGAIESLVAMPVNCQTSSVNPPAWSKLLALFDALGQRHLLQFIYAQKVGFARYYPHAMLDVKSDAYKYLQYCVQCYIVLQLWREDKTFLPPSTPFTEICARVREFSIALRVKYTLRREVRSMTRKMVLHFILNRRYHPDD